MARSSERRRERSQRQLRVGEALRHALAEVLGRRELRDPALANVSITVSEVRVSPDMRNAIAYVLPLGGGDTDVVLEGLGRAAPYLGGQVSRMLRLKYSPRLTFAADTAFDQATRIEGMLAAPEVARDLADGDGGDER